MPFNGWVIYEWNPREGGWDFVILVKQQDSFSDRLKESIKSIMNVGVIIDEEARSLYYEKNCDVRLKLDISDMDRLDFLKTLDKLPP